MDKEVLKWSNYWTKLKDVIKHSMNNSTIGLTANEQSISPSQNQDGYIQIINKTVKWTLSSEEHNCYNNITRE